MTIKTGSDTGATFCCLDLQGWPCVYARLAEALAGAETKLSEENIAWLKLDGRWSRAIRWAWQARCRASAAERRVAELERRESVATERMRIAESKADDFKAAWDEDVRVFRSESATSAGELESTRPVIAAALVWEADSQDSDETEQVLLEAIRTYRSETP